MTATFWLGVAALLIFFLFGTMLLGELKALRGVATQMLGSLAESNWRMKDELAAISKSKENLT